MRRDADTDWGAFAVLVTQACEYARLARLPVQLRLADGTVACGVPDPVAVGADDPREFGGTGYARSLGVGAGAVDLGQVVELQVRHDATG